MRQTHSSGLEIGAIQLRVDTRRTLVARVLRPVACPPAQINPTDENTETRAR
jgi:hypothetical protein